MSTLHTRDSQNNALSKTIIISVFSYATVLVSDKLLLGLKICREGHPDYSVSHLIRTIIVFLATLFIVANLVKRNTSHYYFNKTIDGTFERISLFGVFVLSTIVVSLFIVNPPLFNVLALEDNPVEWLSALLLFGSSAVILSFLLTSFKTTQISKITKYCLTLISIAFFGMGMEEISWFQRVLEIETPTLFTRNQQNEMNLHNFATNYLENIYYFAVFIFLVVLPILKPEFPLISENNHLKDILPRPFLAPIGAIISAYNYDMWNIVYTQISFFGSILILVVYAKFSMKKTEQYLILFAIAYVIAFQLTLLIKGIYFVRLWDITEYKETLISLAFFIYALDISARLRRQYFPSSIQR